MSEAGTATLRAHLLRWYDANKRSMPWRDAPSPWRTWVSEIMLQQTRVESVRPYFARFMARFPTPTALAEAPLDDALALWAGLGYYARIRNLHLAAQQVVARHGGEVPNDPAAFAALRGVGPYTCGAVQSISFGHPLPVLDGNVIRVLSRLDHVTEDPRETAIRKTLWARAEAFAQGPRPGDLNQALMELGATVCTPGTPHCLLCPWRDACSAYREGDAATLPVKAPRKVVPTLHRQAALLQPTPDTLYLVRNPTTGLLGGLWALPAVEGELAGALEPTGAQIIGAPLATIRHAFTHQRWVLTVHPAQGPLRGTWAHGQVFETSALSDLALGGPTLKALRACGFAVKHRRGAGAKP
jgi:A/G-specific adenine glycosylase